jgi:hypothetical protein
VIRFARAADHPTHRDAGRREPSAPARGPAGDGAVLRSTNAIINISEIYHILLLKAFIEGAGSTLERKTVINYSVIVAFQFVQNLHSSFWHSKDRRVTSSGSAA